MTATEWATAKYLAIRALTSAIVQLKNWQEPFPRLQRVGNAAGVRELHFRRGFTLRYRPEDDGLNQYLEVFRDRAYRRYITEPVCGVMLDIGANIGAVSLDWATRLAHVRVHAYEPNPGTFAVLSENVASNGLVHRVLCHQQAVARSAGTLSFSTSGLSVQTTACQDHANASAAGFSVMAISLDEAVARCERDGPVGLVKIDTEGSEAEILEGAKLQTLKAIKQFVIEYHEALCEHALERCHRILTSAGFQCRTRPITAGLGLLYAVQPLGIA